MIIKTLTSLIFASLLFTACSTGSSVDNDNNIPGFLQKKADQFVISKTGKDFFENYIKLQSDRITKTKDGYLVVYNFSIPEKEGVEGEIRFSIDTLGNILNDKEIVGIPGCSFNPEECSFNILKQEAINVAEKSGLEKGIKNWDVNFSWNAKKNKYLWEIRSTLYETKGTEFSRGSGKIMLIDPNDGKIIETSEWKIN